MIIVGDDTDRLVVETQDSSFNHPAVGGLRPYPVAPAEVDHQTGGAGLGYELERLNDQSVEKEEMSQNESCLIMGHLERGEAIRRIFRLSPRCYVSY